MRSKVHHACFQGTPFEHIEHLAMSNPEWIMVQNNAGYTPLQIMCKNGRIHDRIINTFSQIGGPGIFSVVDLIGNTPLHSAMREETDLEALHSLIRAFPDALHIKTTYGNTPLHLACFRGMDPEIIREIALSSINGVGLMSGRRGGPSPLNIPNTSGQTPIGIAMEEFHRVSRDLHLCCTKSAEYKEEQNFAFYLLMTLVKILYYEPNHDDDSDKTGSLLQACVSLHRRDVRLDPAFIFRALQLHPEETRVADDDGNYPLHIEASIPIEKMSLLDAPSECSCSASCHQRIHVLKALHEIYPGASRHRNASGEFPLSLMIQNGRKWDQTFALVLRTFPQGLHWSSGVERKLIARILEKVSKECGLETLFTLISSRPDITGI